MGGGLGAVPSWFAAQTVLRCGEDQSWTGSGAVDGVIDTVVGVKGPDLPVSSDDLVDETAAAPMAGPTAGEMPDAAARVAGWTCEVADAVSSAAALGDGGFRRTAQQ